jgi:hypothetical protein
MESGTELRPWAVRLPAEAIDWLHDHASAETLRRKEIVSMNAVAIEMFQEAMKKRRKFPLCSDRLHAFSIKRRNEKREESSCPLPPLG